MALGCWLHGVFLTYRTKSAVLLIFVLNLRDLAPWTHSEPQFSPRPSTQSWIASFLVFQLVRVRGLAVLMILLSSRSPSRHRDIHHHLTLTPSTSPPPLTPTTPCSDVWFYDARASVWLTDGRGGLNVTDPTLPPGRGSHIAVTLQYNNRTVMLIYAGFACAPDFQGDGYVENRLPLDDVWIYDLADQ